MPSFCLAVCLAACLSVSPAAAQSRQALAAATAQLQQLEGQAAGLGGEMQEADRQLGAWQAKVRAGRAGRALLQGGQGASAGLDSASLPTHCRHAC